MFVIDDTFWVAMLATLIGAAVGGWIGAGLHVWLVARRKRKLAEQDDHGFDHPER